MLWSLNVESTSKSVAWNLIPLLLETAEMKAGLGWLCASLLGRHAGDDKHIVNINMETPQPVYNR
jgi:hypothetical protein